MDAVAFCPPLIIEPSQIEEMLARFALALDDTAKHFGVS
jgi:adenosylmethionine-8-amino-7-oxononanoate aminotransferase